jgi:hypothetical protein
MKLERLLSVVSFALLCAFLAVLVIHVPRVDLGAVLLISVLLCGYDLFIHRSGRKTS